MAGVVKAAASMVAGRAVAAMEAVRRARRTAARRARRTAARRARRTAAHSFRPGAGAQAALCRCGPTAPAAVSARSRASIPTTHTRPFPVQEPERVVTQPQDLRGRGDPNPLGVPLCRIGAVEGVLAQARRRVRHRAKHGAVPRLAETALDQARHVLQYRVLPHLPLDHIGRVYGWIRAEKLPRRLEIPDGQGAGTVKVCGGIIPRALQQNCLAPIVD
eukprot:scaffold4093_cov192-Isochrysis_galbana.AAC.1